MPSYTALSIQQLYDENRESLQLGWFAGFSGSERLISGDAVSAADQIGHLNLIHPGRIQVYGHQETEYYKRLSPAARAHQTAELVAGEPPAFIIAQGLAIALIFSASGRDARPTTSTARRWSRFSSRLELTARITIARCTTTEIQNASRWRDRERSSCNWIRSVGTPCISR